MNSILIVEDDTILRQMMILELSEEGYEIVSAVNGEEAMELMQTKKPDLVLLDLIMPKVDGYAVLREMKALKSPAPAIIMSNVSDPEEMEKCRTLGAIDYVVKSDLDTDEFRATVKHHMSRLGARA